MRLAIAVLVGIFLGWQIHHFFTKLQLQSPAFESLALPQNNTQKPAAVEFEKLVDTIPKLEPNNPPVLQSQAVMLIKQSKLDIARGEYMLALESIEQVLAQVQQDFTDKTLKQLFINTSKAYLQKLGDDNNTEKKHFLLTAVHVLPDYLQFRYLLGELLISLEDYEGAAYQLRFLADNVRWKKQFYTLKNAINYHKNFAQGDIEIPLIQQKNAWHIQVRVDGTTARLILDTGASITTLGAHLIRDDYQRLGNIVLSTANGKTDAVQVNLNTLSVGKVIKQQFPVVVLPKKKLPAGIDGLLGLDWLSSFEFVIDKSHSVLRLTPIVAP